MHRYSLDATFTGEFGEELFRTNKCELVPDSDSRGYSAIQVFDKDLNSNLHAKIRSVTMERFHGGSLGARRREIIDFANQGRLDFIFKTILSDDDVRDILHVDTK